MHRAALKPKKKLQTYMYTLQTHYAHIIYLYSYFYFAMKLKSASINKPISCDNFRHLLRKRLQELHYSTSNMICLIPRI